MKRMYICVILLRVVVIIFAIILNTISLWFMIPTLVFSVATILLMIVTAEVGRQQLKTISIGYTKE